MARDYLVSVMVKPEDAALIFDAADERSASASSLLYLAAKAATKNFTDFSVIAETELRNAMRTDKRKYQKVAIKQ